MSVPYLFTWYLNFLSDKNTSAAKGLLEPGFNGDLVYKCKEIG